jgi:hypothetical protein
MTEEVPDFLGMSLDDIQLKAKEIQSEMTLLFKYYQPEYYKCWGKEPNFTKRAIRQKVLNTGAIEVLLSDFIEHP